MKRYNIEHDDSTQIPSSSMEESPTGEYVLYEDVEKTMQIIKDLSLCVDEFGEAQSTHYVRDGKIEPKGSFIALCERARDLTLCP